MGQSRRLYSQRDNIMLTKKQHYKLNEMVTKYCVGMKKHTKADDAIIIGWGQRYRCAMEQVLQKQDRR